MSSLYENVVDFLGLSPTPEPPPPPEPTILEVIEDWLPLIWRILFVYILHRLLGKLFKMIDPNHKQKEAAKKKAEGIMKRLDMQNIDKPKSFTDYEFMIAAYLICPNELGVCWNDIAGLGEIVLRLKKWVINPILAEQIGVPLSPLARPPKGILLHGSPGCGKTLIAKAMAKEAGCFFINLDAGALTDKYYGESQKLTVALFSLASKLQPCIIFIDEIDSLLRNRSDSDHEVTAMMKAQFMSLWDGLVTDPKKAVILMGATNRAEDLDPAILRRMTMKLKIPVPDQAQRKHILDLIVKSAGLETGADFDIEKLANATDGFSGADLKELARSASVNCLVDLSDRFQELIAARTKPKPKPAKPTLWDWFGFGTLRIFTVKMQFDSKTKDNIEKRDLNGEQAEDGNISTTSLERLRPRPVTMNDFELALKDQKEFKLQSDLSYYI